MVKDGFGDVDPGTGMPSNVYSRRGKNVARGHFVGQCHLEGLFDLSSVSRDGQIEN